ncbi:MAG TPA: hypothetical protein VE954_22320 [Oligoflexus sp.]|uniref:hypothetical protein n=1 Tax=Oligoflexus sp. TaxID=1971216 RepID=UPI002D3DCBE6|nr:hypothetical protein [Oligoflexus sp.]HYX35844.1 hypothetical protein [Oligoflexus sp.]
MIQIILSLVLLASSQSIFASDQKSDESQELEKKLADPVADITSIPLQFNYGFDDENSSMFTVFNLQPVFSGSSDQWLFVNRFVTSYITAETETDSGSIQSAGFGDFTYQLYVTPKELSSVKVAAGFLLAAPTGMDQGISSGKWGLGPTFAMIGTTSQSTYGGLIYQNWSVAGDKERKDVSLLTVQPIFSYRMGNLWSVSPFNNITFDKTLDGEKWNVPMGLQFSKLMLRPFVPVHGTVGVFSNVIHPQNAPAWTLKLQMNFVL